MNEKQLTSLLKELDGGLKIEEYLRVLYLLKAWKILSIKIDDDRLKFEYFYKEKLGIEQFHNIIIDLKFIKIFELFLNQNIRLNRIGDREFKMLFEVVDKELIFSISVFNAFNSVLDSYMDFLVANQIAELGVKLLDCKCPEIYSPFSNAYNIGYYTDKKILAESFADEYIIELMKIIDGIAIDFNFKDPLINPTYVENKKSHLLTQFEYVLSFPPMGLSTNNEFLYKDEFNRFKFHKIKSNREVAHFEHILAQTSCKAVVLTHVGFTYRGNQDEEFRKYLIENNFLETVIQLAPNLHNATSIETTFIIINKQKKDKNIYFLNLKHESFLNRIGRKLILNDVDKIISIYEKKQELENISRLVTTDEIIKNNYSYAIDRYIIAQEAKEMQKGLDRFELKELEEIADIRRSQLFKDEGEGLEVIEISPSDFNKAGFTLECGKTKKIDSQEKKLETYKLEPYDVLLSTKGTIGKVAIIGEISKLMIASQAIQVIRIKDKEKQEKAVSLYMFLKSDLGQTILSSLVAGVTMPQISTVEIKKLNVPNLKKDEEEKLFLNFNSEVEMYNKITNLEQNIKQLHNNFLGAK